MEAEAGLTSISAAGMLRGVVAEQLTRAAQEIFAVVERTVVGYEEEAAGLRREVDRQRRQLEALLQPDIKLETPDDQFPICETAAGGGGGGGLPEEEEQQKYEPGEEDSRYPEVQMDDGDEDDKEEDQEHLSHPDHEAALRSSTPRVRPDRSSAARPQSSEPQEHVDLRICVLEESEMEVLPNSVFQKYPLQQVRCPCDLQEEDFLDLLRSSFPQLAAQEPFDVFMTDRSRRLHPLRVETLTPEEVHRVTGGSALYIRLKPPDDQTSSEEFHPSVIEDAADSPSSPGHRRVQSDRKRSSRRWTNQPKKHIDLKIRILEDSHIHVLSADVFQKYPLQQVRCPCDLQEEDFLDLLRSSFPQLAAQESFDVFMTDQSRRLHPLRVETLTPEEVHRVTGGSALYIRLKPPDDQTSSEEFHPSVREDAADSPSSPGHRRVQSDRKRSSRRWTNQPKKHIDLKIRILEDSHIHVLSADVFQKYPLQQVRCPCDLQEEDFLDLLRSSFPQLAAQEPFDVFMTDRSRRLHPLRVETLTPEEVHRVTGGSALYIRLKPPDDQTSSEEFHPSVREDAADSPSTPGHTRPNTRVQSDGRRSSRRWTRQAKKRIYLKIRILEDSQIDTLTPKVFQKYPLQELRCPCGLQEEDFLDLLRSSFPQLAAQESFDFFSADRSKRLDPLRVETVTPEKVHRVTGRSALYIRLKEREDVQEEQEEEEEEDVQEEEEEEDEEEEEEEDEDVQEEEEEEEEEEEDHPVDAAEGSSSTSEGTKLSTRRSTAPPEDMEAEEGGDDENRVKTRRRTVKRSPVEASADAGDAPLRCKACWVRLKTTAAQIKHAWSHVDDPERLCGVCGEHSEELRSHLQKHKKTLGCNVCGKTFLSISGLKGHVARHEDRTPHQCQVCHKIFAQLSVFVDHKQVHAADTLHKCDLCRKSFVSKLELACHRSTHTDRKLYASDTGGKPVRSRALFSRHTARHSARLTPLRCGVCGQTFNSNYRLEIHLRNHAGKRTHACTKCSKQFLRRAHLWAHRRVHGRERLHHCPVCNVAFSQIRSVQRHMTTHHCQLPPRKTTAAAQSLTKRMIEH
ncbi:uncharacterized protein [Pempheris klunzingeri]|uniref:uncharacterized protein n=1 Tax=Pempheris klunzingeri TaxID=3127111 RepID=UPI00397F7367